MKITCQSCAAKYTIADEKVAGKTVKIKCKKCGATIVVNGAEVGYQAAPADPGYGHQAPPPEGGDEEEGDGQTTVLGAEQAAAHGMSSPPGGEFTVNVADDDQRTMSSDQIAAAYAAGTVTNDTYVWRDGMADWSPLSGVPELMTLVSRPAPAAQAPPRPQAPAAPVGLAGAVMMNDAQPAAAAAPTAARRAASRPAAADPFQASQQAAAAAAPPPAPKHDRSVGERNENSMLFSISALTAAKDARDKDRSGAKNGGRGGVDDILNLSGGASPMLAPPPLLAPVVEAPPMAAPMSPMMAPNQGMGMGMGMGQGAPMQQMGGAMPSGMDDVYPRKKSPVGLIVGIVAGLAIVGGVAFFFATKTDPAVPPTTPDQAAVSATPTTPTAPSAAQTTVAVVDTGAAPMSLSGEPTAAAGTTGPKATTPGPTGPAVPGTGKPPTPSATPTAEPAPVKTAETAAPPAEGAEFNRGAASSALGGAAGAAKACKKPDGPTGSGRVKVTFAPSGNVTSAQVEGAPFAGTPVGGCIASAFRGAKVPPFSGPPVSVSKSFSIN